jgi:hypothetical protein
LLASRNNDRAVVARFAAPFVYLAEFVELLLQFLNFDVNFCRIVERKLLGIKMEPIFVVFLHFFF